MPFAEAASTDPPHAAPDVSLRALFFRFLQVGLSGFGGVLPFARHMLVEQRHWLTEHEFAEMLSLGQFLPGPNIVNVTIMVGRRFHGGRGAVVAVLGLMLMPMVIVIALAAVYGRFADVAVVRHALTGVAAAASGLVLSMAAKTARTLRRSRVAVLIAAASFAAIALLRLPLFAVLAVVVPLGIAWQWWLLAQARRDTAE
jgi:chromate transporter